MTDLTKTYAKLFTAKMIAAKLTKRLGVTYIPVGPSAVDGSYTVELEVSAPVAPAPIKKAVKIVSQPTPSKTRVKFEFGPATEEEQVIAVLQYSDAYADQGGVIAQLAKMPVQEILPLIAGCTTRWGAIVSAKTVLTAA